MVGYLQIPVQQKLNDAEEEFEFIEPGVSTCQRFVGLHSNKKITFRDISKVLNRLLVTSIAVHIVSFCLYFALVLSLIIACIYHPSDACSALIFCFSILNFCIWMLIKVLRVKSAVDIVIVDYCQQARSVVFPFVIFVSTLASLGDINGIASLVLYIMSGLLLLFDIAIKIHHFADDIDFYRRITQITMDDSYKQRKFTDQTDNSSDFNSEINKDKTQHLQITLVPPSKV